MLATNSVCNTELHHLVADAIEVCGGSRKLLRILNRLEICVSCDTHDRFVTSIAEEQRKSSVWNELSPNTFTVASADNINFLSSHAAVYCGNQSRSYHGTTIQIVQPVPSQTIGPRTLNLSFSETNHDSTSIRNPLAVAKRILSHSPSQSPHKHGKYGPKRKRTLESEPRKEKTVQNQISTMTNYVQYSNHASLTISHFFESNEEISSRERLFTQVCIFFFQKAVLLPHEDDAIVFKSLRDFLLQSEAQLKDNESSNIYYMELIDENADSMETMSQVAEMVQQKLIGTAQQQIILVGDGKRYQHLQQSKRVYGDALKNILIFPGDWHILKNFQQVLMKQYYHFGLKDIASNSGFRAETLSSLERCSNFKRTHNFLLQAWESLFLEMVESFINENTSLATTQVKEEIKVMIEANNDEPIQYLLNVQSILNEDVLVVFYHFIKNQASIDDTWKIWMHFVFEDFFSYFCLYKSIRT